MRGQSNIGAAKAPIRMNARSENVVGVRATDFMGISPCGLYVYYVVESSTVTKPAVESLSRTAVRGCWRDQFLVGRRSMFMSRSLCRQALSSWAMRGPGIAGRQTKGVEVVRKAASENPFGVDAALGDLRGRARVGEAYS